MSECRKNEFAIDAELVWPLKSAPMKSAIILVVGRRMGKAV